MDKNYETRHIFLAVAVIIAVFSPIFYFFVPQTVGEITNYTKGVWFVSTPKENFITFGVGFGSLFISSILLFLLDIRKLSILLSILFLGFSFTCFFISSQSYVSLSNETISYSPLFTLEDYSYNWDEIKEVIHYRSEEGSFSEYELIFKDDQKVIIEDNPYFREKFFKFDEKVNEYDIVVTLSIVDQP